MDNVRGSGPPSVAQPSSDPGMRCPSNRTFPVFGSFSGEVIAFADYIAGKGEAGARASGKFRLEGKEYVVQEGDVMHFRFNV